MAASDDDPLAAALDRAVERLRAARGGGLPPPGVVILRELAGAFVAELFPDAASAAVVVDLHGRRPASSVIPLPLPVSRDPSAARRTSPAPRNSAS